MVRDHIKLVHREKDAAYGSSWKRRGELTSILANIARKVDRLDNYASVETTLSDESILDTSLDLFVYLTKYRLFLLERLPTRAALLPASAPRPLSDHTSNFDALVDKVGLECGEADSVATLVAEATAGFADLHNLASVPSPPLEPRFDLATRLATVAWRLSIAIMRDQPEFLETMRRRRRAHAASSSRAF